MSHAANPNKPKKQDDSQADVVARKQKAEKDRIRKLIITLGDENKKVVSQIRGLTAALEEDVEMHGDLMRRSILDCTGCLPTKSGIYAAWVAKMAEKHPKWAATVVSGTMEELQAALQEGLLSSTQLQLRFLVSLACTGVLGVSAVLNLLKQVMGLSEGLRPSNGGDFGCFVVLAQLPFLSKAAYEKGMDDVAGLIAGGRAYIEGRDSEWAALLQVVQGEELPDRLEEIQKGVERLSSNGWASQVVLHVPGFHPAASSMAEMPDLQLDVKVAEFHKSCANMQVSHVAARLLTTQLHDDAPMSDVDRWVLEDHVLLTVEMFCRDIEECSKQILRIPVLHPQFEAAVVEILFCQMLQLPVSRLPPLFYCRLLEACADKQTSMNKMIDEAFQALFPKIPSMDEDCLDVLAEAFACRLAKNTLQADWSIFVGTEVAQSVIRFAKRTLERLQRLLEHQNLMHKLPQALHALAPLEPKPASGLAVVSKPQFGRLINLVRLKDANPAKVLEFGRWLLTPSTQEAQEAGAGADAVSEEVPGQEEACDMQPPKRRKIDTKPQARHEEFGDLPTKPWHLEEVAELIFAVMLQHGHKTPTHMAKILDGHAEVLRQLRPTDDNAGESFCESLVRYAFDFWRASGHRLEITLDSLLQRKVLTPRSVVKVALSSKDCDSLHAWNIVRIAARKSLERSQAARSDLALADNLAKLRGTQDGPSEGDALEKRRTELLDANQEAAGLFTCIFTSLVRNFEGAKSDAKLRGIMLGRITSIGRRYVSEIKPLVVTAGRNIPGVASNPEIAKVFAILSSL